jgi:hypothetical protein
MCCILSSTNTFGAKQCTALHKQIAALHKFLSALPIIWALVTEKGFCKIQDGVPLKLKKNIQHHNTKVLAID